MARYIDKRDLGSYASIAAVWAAYPEGGQEGDYLTVNGVKYRWDKYDRLWVADPNFGPTPARSVTTFDDDVYFQSDVIIAGWLRAKHVKQPCVGWFSSEEALLAHYPTPEVGMYAVVGRDPALRYVCEEEGVWTNTEVETTGFDPLDLTEIEEAIAALESGNYYDASWITDSTQFTVENFDALYEAAVTKKITLCRGNFTNLDPRGGNMVRVLISYYKSYRNVEVWNTEGVISVEWPSAVSFALDSDINALVVSMTDIGVRVGTLETWKTNVGSLIGASYVGYSNSDSSYIGKNNLKAVLDHMISITPKYQSANWLEDEDEEEQSHPGRRIAIRFTSMVKAINGNRLIKLYGNTATSSEVVSDSIIVLTFLVTNSTGKSKVVYYRVTYTDGEDYCYVEKHEVPMPYYDATWAKTYGGSREQMDEFINVIQDTPRSLIMAGNQPVVWSAMRNMNVVQFAVMIDCGMRTYTVEYDSGAGETRSSYIDKSF